MYIAWLLLLIFDYNFFTVLPADIITKKITMLTTDTGDSYVSQFKKNKNNLGIILGNMRKE